MMYTSWDVFDFVLSLLGVQFRDYGPQKSNEVQLDKYSGIKPVFIPNYKLQ